MRWARHHLENSRGVLWPAGGPRWHLIVDSTADALVGACHRAVVPPFDLVTEVPANMRCRKCDDHVGAAAMDAEMAETPPHEPAALSAAIGDNRRELLAIRAVVISGRNALGKTPDPEDREGIKHRLPELLGQLEEGFIRHGADAEVLARLEVARRGPWEMGP